MSVSYGDGEQYSLKWNNFYSNLSNGFVSLMENEDLVDVTLVASGGQYLRAHKMVLSVCSPYFKELFKTTPCKHPVVVLKDVSHKELSNILQFMYRGEVHINQEQLTTFLSTAESLQVRGLTGKESDSTPNCPVSRNMPQYGQQIHQEKHSSRSRTSRTLLSPPHKRIRTDIENSTSVSPDANADNSMAASSICYANNVNSKEVTTSGFVLKTEPNEEVNGLVLEDMDASNTNVLRNQSIFTSLFFKDSNSENQSSLQQDLLQSEFVCNEAGSSLHLQSSDDVDTTKDCLQFITNSRALCGKDDVTCHHCSKVMRRSSMKRHIIDRHLPNQDVLCHICAKRFRTQNSLHNHLSLYHRESLGSCKAKNSQDPSIHVT